MIEGKEIEKYLSENPIFEENIKNMGLSVSDIRYITFEGWFGESGIFAWHYPEGVPHYCRID